MILLNWLASIRFRLGQCGRSTVNRQGSESSRHYLARRRRGRSSLVEVPAQVELLEGRALLAGTTASVTSVTMSGPGIDVSGNGDLNAGHNVTVSVNFSGPVTVTSTNGLPTLSLNDGGTATYSGGTGTSKLTFIYSVLPGQNTNDLSVTAFNLNNATIQNAAGAAILTGAATNPAGTLQVDTIAPTVSLALVGASTQIAGTALQYSVKFSEPVTGVDSSSFSLSTTGVSGAAISSVTLTDSVHNIYTVNVSSGTGFGTVGLNITGANVRDLAGNGLGGGNFAAQQTFGAGASPFSVTIADLNGDGKPDLVVANGNSTSNVSTISVLLGSGNGTFASQQTYNTGNGSNPVSVTVADVNGDGIPDLVVVNSGSNSVGVLIGNGNGTFAAQKTYATGSAPESARVADLNGDGKPDLVVANSNANTVSVLKGNGNGTFAAQQTFAAGAGPKSIALGDLNGDGKLDLIVADADGNLVNVLLGNGNGTFAAAQSFSTGTKPFSVAIADFNGDGLQDLVVANEKSKSVSVLLGNGNGTFAAQQTVSTGLYPASVTAADLNGDGKIDLAVANFGDATVSLLWGNGDGTFAAQQTFSVGVQPYSVTFGDLNGDGRPDLVVANEYGSSVSELLNGNSAQAGPVFNLSLPATVSSVTTSGTGISSGNGDLNAGKSVTLTVTFTASVVVDTTNGVPTLGLNDGGIATYSGGSGTNSLTFVYTVAAGQNTSDLTVTAFNLNNALLQNGGVNSDTSGAVTNPQGILQIDTVAPTTTAAVTAGTLGNHGYYTTTTTVAITPFDSASSVSSTSYRIDGGSWNSYSVPFTVTGDGTHTVTYYSVDNAGNTQSNQTLTVKVDTVAPTTTAAVTSGTLGNNGYYTTTPTITISPADATSGVATTSYQIDGGSVTPYTAPFTVSGQGTHTVTYYSVDNAGNTQSNQTLTVKVDTVAPTVNIALVGGATLIEGTGLQFAVTFSEAVTGVDLSGFSLATTGVSGASITGVTSTDASHYTVNVASGVGSGTIGLKVTGTAIVDVAGNSLSVPQSGPAYTLFVPQLTLSVNPVNITYGTRLADSQLSGTATYTDNGSPVTVPGAYTYTSAAGSELNAGYGQSESVTFTPADTARYYTTTSTVTVNVDQATATIQVNPDHGTYDGTAQSASGSVIGVDGESLSGLDLTATRHIHAGIYLADPWTFTDSTGNYKNSSGTVDDSIARADVTISAVTSSKEYDGSSSSTAVPIIIVGALGAGDTLTATESFDSVHAGTRTLSVDNSYILTDASDYNVTLATATGTIQQASLTISAVSDSRGYDGTTTSAAVPTITSGSLIGGDTLTATESFDSRHAGSRTLTVDNTYILTNASDYNVTLQSATGTITPAALTISAVYNTKVFDNTTSAGATPFVSGLFGGDTVTGAVESYVSKAALGNNKNALVVTGYTVNDGNGGKDYLVTTNAASGTITFAASKIAFLSPFPTIGTAGVTLSPKVKIAVEDKAGNIVDSDNLSSVTLGVKTGPASAVFDSASVLTMAVSNGIATFSNLIFDTSGKYTIAAGDGALTGATSGLITVYANVPSQLVVQQNPSDGTAGIALAPVVKVLVQDVFGNVVTAATPVTLTLDTGTFPNGKTSVTVTSTGGIATFNNLIINSAGNYYLTASTGVVSATAFPVTIVPAAASKLVYLQQPASSGTAGAALSSVEVVAVEDKFGNVVTSDNSSIVTLTLSNGGFASGPSITANVSGGLATFGAPNGPDVVINKTGLYRLKATDGGLTAAYSSAFSISPAATTQIVVQATPTRGTAGVVLATPVKVALEDTFGNIATGDNSNVTLTISSSPTGGVFEGTSTVSVAAQNGIAIFNNLALDVSGKYTFNVDAESLPTATTGVVTVSPAAPTQLILQQSPTVGTAGVAFTPPVKVLVEDQFGNLVAGNSTVTLTLDHGTFSTGKTTVSTTAFGGVATFNNLILNVADSYLLTATDSVTPLSTQSFGLTISPAAASKLVFSQQPASSTVAGTPLSSVEVVAVQDKFGNLITTDNSSTVTLTLSSGAFATGTSVTANVSGGYATFGAPSGPDLIINKTGSYTLRAFDGALTSAKSTVFSITPAATSQIAIQAVPPKGTAGTLLGTSVKVALLDSFGNIATGDNSDVTLSIATGPTGGVFEGASTLTVAAQNGIALFSNLTLDTSGKYTLNADSESLPTATSGAITISPAAPSQLILQQTPTTGTAGVALAPSVKVLVEDVYGNLVTTVSAVTLTLDTGTFSNGKTTATANAIGGTAIFSNLIINTAGNYNLTATDSVTPLSSPSFGVAIVAAAASKLIYLQSPPATGVAGVVLSPAVAVAVEDKFGNLIVSDSSSTVALTLNTGTFANGKNFAIASVVGGVATFAAPNGADLLINKIGNYTLKATDGTLTSVTSGIVSISPAATSQIVFQAVPATGTAGAGLGIVKVLLEDSLGNIATGDNSNVTLSVASGPAGADFAAGSTLSVAAVSGVAQFSNLVLNTSGKYTFHADAESLTEATSVNSTINPAAASKLVFLSEPSAGSVGVALNPAVTVAVQDKFGNLVTTATSVTLSLASTTTGGGFSPGSTVTASSVNGIATFGNLKLKAGTYSLLASSGALSKDTSSSFVVS